MTSSLAVFDLLQFVMRCTVAAVTWTHAHLLCHAHPPITDHRDICQSYPDCDVTSHGCHDNRKASAAEGCGTISARVSRICADDVDDMTSSTGCHDNDVTSYSVLSAGDVSQLLPVYDDNNDTRDARRLDDEIREIARDLDDIRACTRLVSTRCHDDEWRHGYALTLGVAEALTPVKPQTTRLAVRDMVDWQLDESALDYESRDTIVDRKLSLGCGMTSSPADDSVAADLYIDDELDDVIV